MWCGILCGSPYFQNSSLDRVTGHTFQQYIRTVFIYLSKFKPRRGLDKNLAKNVFCTFFGAIALRTLRASILCSETRSAQMLLLPLCYAGDLRVVHPRPPTEFS